MPAAPWCASVPQFLGAAANVLNQVRDMMLAGRTPHSRWQLGGVFDLFHHRVGPGFAHTWQLPQRGAGKRPVGGHVGQSGLDHVVKTAGHNVTL